MLADGERHEVMGERCRSSVVHQQFGSRYFSQVSAAGVGSNLPGSATVGEERRAVLKEPISNVLKGILLCCSKVLKWRRFSSSGCMWCQIKASTLIQQAPHYYNLQRMLVKFSDLSLNLPLIIFSFASLVLCLSLN